jgi:hypothetical protein
MKIALKIFLISILALQCKSIEENNKLEKDWTETQKSRKYFDYARFIQKHPKSEHFEKALSKYFFFRDSVTGFSGCGKYNTSISVLGDEKKLFNQELKNIDSLRYLTYQYLKNGIPNISTHKYVVKIPESKMWDSISKGHFDIVIYNNPFPVKSLKLVLGEISIGISYYKKHLSEKWFDLPYNELTNGKKNGIDELNDTRFSFFDFSSMKDKTIKPQLPPEF